MEGIFVLLSTATVVSILVLYFLSGMLNKSCPKCQGPLSKDHIDNEDLLVCQHCGHILRKKD